jgi:transposase
MLANGGLGSQIDCIRLVAKASEAGVARLNRKPRKWITAEAAYRAAVRRSLYMATLVATQHNQLIRRYYRQLLDRGKAKMTALVACMRKLLLILNAMIKNNSPWRETITP